MWQKVGDELSYGGIGLYDDTLLCCYRQTADLPSHSGAPQRSLMHGGGAVLSAKVNRTAKAVRYIATRRLRRGASGQAQTEQSAPNNGE